MARYDERSGNLYVTELGRVASHFYIMHASIIAFNSALKPTMTGAEVGPAPVLQPATRPVQAADAGQLCWTLCCHRGQALSWRSSLLCAGDPHAGAVQ